MNALQSSTTASTNTAVGFAAGAAVTTGGGSVLVGYNAGANITTGASNVCLGQSTGVGTPFGLFNLTTENDRVIIGSGNTTNAYVQVAWTVVSDARDKTDVVNAKYGLNFVMGLRPVEYKWDKRGWYDNLTPDGSKKGEKSQLGFLAQDVISLEKQHGGVAGDLLIGDDEQEDSVKVTESKIIPVLVKAIQEQQAIIESLKARLDAANL